MEEPSKSYSIEKLNESNYRSWSQVIESHLDDQDLWEVVQGKETQPKPPLTPTTSAPQSSDQAATDAASAMEGYETKLEAWTKKAKKARKMIISTISPSVMTYVEGTRDPAEMWTILEGRYKPKTRVTLRQLQRQFNTIRMTEDDGNMEKHLQKIEQLKRQIEEQGEQISDSSYVSVLLNCAPARYDVQVSILEAQDDVTSGMIINWLLEEYRKYQAERPEEKKMALLTNQSRQANQKGGKSKKNSSSPRFNGNCNHCNRQGHKEAQCWTKHPELKPEKSRKDEKSERPKFALMATTTSAAIPKRQSGPHTWYTDSRASDHFSPHKELFETFRKLEEPIYIETADGTVTGTGMGTITVTVMGGDELETELQLNNVIYAPNMSSNLFSLMAAYDKGFETRITPGHGLRIFYRGAVIATTVRVHGGLFRLRTPADSYAMAAQAASVAPEFDINTWHRRMGHLGEDNVRKLQKLADGVSIKARMTVGVCEACLEGKQHRQPSHQPATRAKEPLELIHSDLCGPIDPTTYGGTNYYLLFTDDLTRMTYIYPLKKKSSADVLEKFKEYKPEVEKQTGKLIKRLRTDGGGDYERWMEAHLKGSGIIHETTAPYSPDQNGVAERANRTIMETVKAIIGEFKLDKKLWMELADTVVCLKNRSPTTAVATMPYELWHGVKPDLSHLRIIGSTAYVHIPKEKRTKLDTHSHKGIMIGYGGGTNQYKVWDLTRKDIVVSRDVVFIEGKPIAQTPATYVEEPRTRQDPTMDMSLGSPTDGKEPKIVHDSITVLPGPPEPKAVDPGILLQESASGGVMIGVMTGVTTGVTTGVMSGVTGGATGGITSGVIDGVTGGVIGGVTSGAPSTSTQRASGRTGKGTFTTKKFTEEDFDKPPRVRMAKIARNIDPNDEDEPTTVQEAINHPTRGKQWEKAIQEEVNSLIKNHTWDLISRPRNRQLVTNKFAFKHKKHE